MKLNHHDMMNDPRVRALYAYESAARLLEMRAHAARCTANGLRADVRGDEEDAMRWFARADEANADAAQLERDRAQTLARFGGVEIELQPVSEDCGVYA